MHLQTIIYRHKKENKKKCSLKGLEKRADMRFFEYPTELLPELQNYILLDLDAPCLSVEDKDKGLLLIDGTWNYAKKMCDNITKDQFIARSLPINLVTAYPRKQTGCLDPQRGLASIEALYAAYRILERDTEGLLDNYYWKDLFLEKNYKDVLLK